MGYKIITHYGKAHMDELLAVSLIAVYRDELPEEITRINAQDAAEILNRGEYGENTYFIDCGLVFNPDRLLFDHHQDSDSPCSALLVFNHFFPGLAESRLHNYLKLVSAVDTRGQKALPDYETSSESRKYFSFSQNLLLKAFEDNPLVIVSLFKEGLEEKIDFEKKRQEAAEWLSQKGNVEIEEVAGFKILVYNNRPPEGLFKASCSEDKEIVDSYAASAVYSFDEKNESVRTLYRTNHGYENIDFSQADVSEPVFCHKGGFLLKFIPSSEKEWHDILCQSSLEPQYS